MRPNTKGKSNRKSVRQSIIQQANYRGIFAVRRELSPESYDTIQEVADNLAPELHNVARIFDPRTIGVTVVGFSRFDRRHCGKGPSTASMVERVPSARQPLEVGLGSLAVFGSESKHKLSVEIFSDDLVDEELRFVEAYDEAGFPLKREHNGDGTYTPHLSVALLYGDQVAHFINHRTLDKLDAITGLGHACGQTVLLKPVRDHPAS